VEEIEKAAKRASVLTRQLLAFSRRQTLERKNIDLNDVINDTMKMLRRLISEDIEVQIQGKLKLSTVYADPRQIEQILMNLAVNARDAMPEGGRLLIETKNVVLDKAYCTVYPYTRPGKYVQISITDNGTGMDTETLQRIFEPFFTTKEVGQGTGLGLAVVYGIVKQHEGFIESESELGRGTTFKIYFPAVDEAIDDIEEPQGEQYEFVPGGTETILIAEDEPSLRALTQDILKELGYRVLIAKDGEEALKLYKLHYQEIDLVLMDIVMPRKSGPEAYKQMRDFGGDVPVIFMTGYSTDVVLNKFNSQNEVILEDHSIVIQKPYNSAVLGLKVSEVLNKYSAQSKVISQSEEIKI
jgi:CheY-like chemotaxis protein